MSVMCAWSVCAASCVCCLRVSRQPYGRLYYYYYHVGVAWLAAMLVGVGRGGAPAGARPGVRVRSAVPSLPWRTAPYVFSPCALLQERWRVAAPARTAAWKAYLLNR